ncbi:MAG: ABC transporter permease subunit [Polyangiaceae bacterium]
MSATSSVSPTRAFFRLEIADSLRSRWVTFTAAVYVVVFGSFVWLGLRESSVLGFTGLSRVVLNVSNAVVIVLPLVSLVATSQTIVRARTTGFFELLLAQPCRRRDWFRAVLASRLAVIVAPLVALLLVTLLAGAWAGETALTPLVVRSTLCVTSLVWAFVGVGLLISAIAPTSERATVYALLAWLTASALHDFALIGLLLRARVAPAAVFGLAALNPVEAARLAILGGIDPELSILGPVGFWLVNTLGPRWTLLVGVGWPALLGTACAWVALRRFERSDLVG